MNSKTKPLIGIMVIVIGSAHTTLGIVSWVLAARATGAVHSAENFWFTIFGVVAIVLGVTIVELERSRGYLTPAVLIGIAALMAAGLAFMPLSGFLTLIVPLAFGAYGWLRRGRRSVSARAGVVDEVSDKGYLG